VLDMSLLSRTHAYTEDRTLPIAVRRSGHGWNDDVGGA
jgi:hypothetical protein